MCAFSIPATYASCRSLFLNKINSMLVSHRWLQKYFEQPLPPAEEIARALTFGVAEVENVERVSDDTVLDVKILPDRACYLLSHRGIAREVSTLLNIPMKDDPLRGSVTLSSNDSSTISVSVDDSARAPFYALARIEGIKVGTSPEWLKEALASIGQKSINNIVDATNYVMFDLGTPLHAFDAEKLSGVIKVRAANDREKITVLGGQEKELTKEMTLITDEKSDTPIAIAGVKGGTYAEVSNETTSILLEAAKFDPVRTRKTAFALNLRTDASKRFENNIATELPLHGLSAAIDLIVQITGGACAEIAMTSMPEKVDYTRGVARDDINSFLGLSLSDDEVSSVFARLGLTHEKIANPIAHVLGIIRAQVGKPYKLGASISREAPHRFDCSGLVAYAYAQAGVFMPRMSVDQYAWGEEVARESVLPGDLMFFNTEQEGMARTATVEYMKGTPIPSGVSHVAMYVGDGVCIHARSAAGVVVEEKITDVEARAKPIGIRRVAHAPTPRFIVHIPFERLDLHIPYGVIMPVPQDLIEEVGRVVGYEKVESRQLPAREIKEEINPGWFWSERVRGALAKVGFVEVYTYSLQPKGEVRLKNPLASDKSFLRESLRAGMEEALAKAEYNAPLTGREDVLLYEIGHVFSEKGEFVEVAVGARAARGKKQAERTNAFLDVATAALKESGADLEEIDRTSEIVLYRLMPSATTSAYPKLPLIQKDITYTPVSGYPFILRDIALWVPEGVEGEEVGDVLRKTAGELLHTISLFDSFKKENRQSFAFHLVFQSTERTLSDTEINEIMNRVHAMCTERGWEVR